jgi:hypothetical protein
MFTHLVYSVGMNKKVIARKNLGTGVYDSLWEVVDRANPGNIVERRVFITRSEARKFARVRNQSHSFIEAVRVFINS